MMHAMARVCERLTAMVNPAVKDVFEKSPIENAGKVRKQKPAWHGMQSPDVPNDKEHCRRGIAYEPNPVIRLVRRQPFQSSFLNSALFRGVGHDSVPREFYSERHLLTTGIFPHRLSERLSTSQLLPFADQYKRGPIERCAVFLSANHRQLGAAHGRGWCR